MSDVILLPGELPSTPDLELGLELARVADTITFKSFGKANLVVETKPDLTPVTDVDRGVEEFLREVIETKRPGDAVIGEEYGASNGAKKVSRRWIIDPIDGTKNYVRGIPVWATLIALEENGIIMMGVVSAPAIGRRWWAARGIGAYAGPAGPISQWDKPPTPIAVSKVNKLADSQLSAAELIASKERPDCRISELAAKCWRSRGFGDFWSHMLVAEGACDIGVDPVVSLWDLAALQVIVEEAGGRFTNLEGEERVDGGSAVSSNGLLHDEALAVLTGSAKGG